MLKYNRQHGFTLLELLVAMAIFAVLAVAGWQVFDNVNRSREKAQFYADQLSELQYAYLQLQQDMGQVVAYQQSHVVAVNDSDNTTSADNTNTNTNKNAQSNNHDGGNNKNTASTTFQLQGNQLTFIRYADPDPRYQVSPSLERIAYYFDNEKQQLIRRQYSQLQPSADEVSLDSILLTDVQAGVWQALLPQPTASFPTQAGQSNQATNINNNLVSLDEARGQAGVTGLNAGSALLGNDTALLLPKGVAVNFTYQEIPITWQFVLPSEPPTGDSVEKPKVEDKNSEGKSEGGKSEDKNSENQKPEDKSDIF